MGKYIGFIYITTNLLNGKIYIGKHELKDAVSNRNYLGSGVLLTRAINKYGKRNFKRRVLKLCKTKRELQIWEYFYIKKYKSQDKSIGYNIADGDVNTTEHNPANIPEVVEKMTIKNRVTTSNPEWRKRQSEILKEYYKTHSAANKGKKVSEERKRLQSDTMKRKYANGEIVNWLKGGHLSKERRLRQSNTMKRKYASGELVPHNKGGHLTEEQKRILSDKAKQRISPCWGSVWYNNGSENKRIYPGDVIPKGFVKGIIRVKRQI